MLLQSTPEPGAGPRVLAIGTLVTYACAAPSHTCTHELVGTEGSLAHTVINALGVQGRNTAVTATRDQQTSTSGVNVFVCRSSGLAVQQPAWILAEMCCEHECVYVQRQRPGSATASMGPGWYHVRHTAVEKQSHAARLKPRAPRPASAGPAKSSAGTPRSQLAK